MKYIMYWEYCPEDTDKIIEKNRKLGEELERHPEKHPKILFPPHHYGSYKGLTILDAEPEHLAASNIYWFPVMKLKFVPIYSSAELTELYLKSK